MACTLQRQCILLALVLVLGVWASQVVARTLEEAFMLERHEQWMARYGRVYHNTTEKERRFMIFKDNVQRVESFNKAGDRPYKLSVNEFSDLTNEEFKASRTGYVMSTQPRLSSMKTIFRYENVDEVQSSLDWREKGAVTPIKDQGSCGKR